MEGEVICRPKFARVARLASRKRSLTKREPDGGKSGKNRGLAWQWCSLNPAAGYASRWADRSNVRDFADELIHLAGNLDDGTTSPSQAYDDLHAIAKDLQSEKNWADEYFRKWQSAEQSVHPTGLRAWLIGFFCGGGFMYLVFVAVGIARR